jgi:hypothetical protein
MKSKIDCTTVDVYFSGPMVYRAARILFSTRRSRHPSFHAVRLSLVAL